LSDTDKEKKMFYQPSTPVCWHRYYRQLPPSQEADKWLEPGHTSSQRWVTSTYSV